MAWAAAAPYIATAASSLLGGLSGSKGAKAQNRTTQMALNAPVNVPEDVKQLRGTLSQLFTSGLRDGRWGIDPSIVNGLEAMFRERSSPDFLDNIAKMFDPQATVDAIGAARQPLLERNLRDQSDANISRFGASGNRADSTSFKRYDALARGNTLQGFEADLMNLFPGLQQNQLAALGLGVDAQNFSPQFLQYRQGLQLNPMRTAGDYASVGVGGTNAGAAASSGYASPSGSFLNSAAGGLALIPQIQAGNQQNAWLNSLIGNRGPSSVGPTGSYATDPRNPSYWTGR